MIRSALLLIIAVACFSCAPSPPPPPSGPTLACAIANVGTLPASFDPTSANGTPVSAGAAPPNIQADILAAYNTAPPFFKDQLCRLTGIFVTSGPRSWGYRNINDGARYIAISTDLWSGNPPGPITLDEYENRVFGPPLSWPPPGPHDDPTPTYGRVTPNNGTMTILAALAHEFGHLFWSDNLVSPRGTHPQSSRFCSKILTNYWTGNLQPAVWKKFEDTDPNPADITDDPNDPPPPGDPGPREAKVLRMIDALKAGNIKKAHRILGRILAPSRPFPSLLGAFSADEQFVETFTLYTLLHATPPLTSAPLQVSPGLVRDIPATITDRKRLSKVLVCFDPLVNPPSHP